MNVFEIHESEVRTYCRQFPATFVRAKGSEVYDATGRVYLDFFSGAGALNYGHNHDVLKSEVRGYLDADSIVHSLDLATEAKRRFIGTFAGSILRPRGLDYKLQFPGPTGTNAVEAALKLARKATGRTNVVAFTNAFHGASLGSLAATTNPAMRRAAQVPLGQVTFMPYDGYFGHEVDALHWMERMLEPGSGIEPPAAVLLELVQGEGGLRSASFSWFRKLAELTRRIGALLIVDDIQAGCGRTGTFFSFEGSGVAPDLVCLSKSISGFGLPMSLLLIAPQHDVWAPGEHNGTFRGHNLAFVSAAAAIEYFWTDDAFEREVLKRVLLLEAGLKALAESLPDGEAEVRGRGMMRGLAFRRPGLASEVSQEAFRRGLIAETCGVHDQVLKLLPPLTTSEEMLEEGLKRIGRALRTASTGQQVGAQC